MSNLTEDAVQPCDELPACGAIEHLIQPREKDLGEFSVRRLLPVRQQRMVGPWVFFDHMGPADFPAGEGIDVRPHPHIGLATVSYLFEGEMRHRDSLGNDQTIRPGDINLMVAGRGIVHRLHGLQLWLGLPEADEETDPEFLHYPSADIPALNVDDVPVRVMMGSTYGATSPVKTFSETLYVEAHLQPGQRLVLPDAEERALYVADGALKARDAEIPEHGMAVFSQERGIEVVAERESRIAIIGGASLGKRYIEWNFVSSRKVRIAQAKDDWTEGRFDKVPGDEEEFIPLPG